MGHLKALNYPDYPDKLSADNPVSGYLKNGTIRHSLVGRNSGVGVEGEQASDRVSREADKT